MDAAAAISTWVPSGLLAILFLAVTGWLVNLIQKIFKEKYEGIVKTMGTLTAKVDALRDEFKDSFAKVTLQVELHGQSIIELKKDVENMQKKIWHLENRTNELLDRQSRIRGDA